MATYKFNRNNSQSNDFRYKKDYRLRNDEDRREDRPRRNNNRFLEFKDRGDSFLKRSRERYLDLIGGTFDWGSDKGGYLREERRDNYRNDNRRDNRNNSYRR